MDASEVAVVRLGTMGAGIAEVFARAGLTVAAIEVDPGALERGMATLDRSRMHECYAEPAFAPALLLAEHAAAGLALG
jgi:3-hydroxyacyl-CoA dehydrogenase